MPDATNAVQQPEEDSDLLQGYQDDLDTSEDAVDEATHDETDDPTEELGVPADELADELAMRAIDEREQTDDDMRESIEDADEEQMAGSGAKHQD